MSEPFLGELRIVSFNFPPKGWALANGQLMPINQNQALFSLLGTFYGGDGRTTFALPNLQGRGSVHQGNGFTLGQAGGEAAHTLSAAELPAHSHPVAAGGALAKLRSPANATWATTTNGLDLYAASAGVALAPQAVGLSSGGGQPHENQPPYLVLNVVIALVGIFPSQN